MKVFLCENIHRDALALLKTRAEVVSDWKRIGEVDAAIDRNYQLDEQLLSQMKNLKAVAIHGTGTDGVDLKYCDEHGIKVFNVPHQNADSVAEHIVALSLALMRKIHLADRLVCSGAEIANAPPELMGSELSGKTLGLIGTGDIAMRAARIMRDGFRVKVIGWSRSLTPEKARLLGIEYCADKHEVLKNADIVSIGVSLNDETTDLIGEREFECMKSSAILINTARGAIVNADALYKALTSGRIAGAACDVFKVEPPTPDNPLVGLDNFIATPHIGANTDEALRRVGMKTVEGIFAVMDGKEAENICHYSF